MSADDQRNRTRFCFLQPNGGTSSLRIHAGTWNRLGAIEIAARIVDDNPGVVVEAKVQPA